MTSTNNTPSHTLLPHTGWTINLADRNQVQANAEASDLVDKSQRWHPKITPYRLGTLVITIALGSLKASYTYLGQANVSTTIEWIIGVVVFLTIYILGLYEEMYDAYDGEEDPLSAAILGHGPLQWFFRHDCLDLVWEFLRLFSVQKPSYRSENRKIVVRHYDWHPSVTGYRLLVSVVTLLFGVAKMLCGYLGLGAAANAFDWSFGVIVTSILYILGLYELNDANLVDFLFKEDFSRVTNSIFAFLMMATGIGIGASWTSYSVYGTVRFVKEPFSLTDGSQDLIETFIDGLHDLSLKAMMALMLSLIALLGVLFLVLMLWIVTPAYFPSASLPFHFLGTLRRFVLGKIYKRIMSWASGETRSVIPKETISLLQTFLRYTLRTFVHIVVHAFSFVFVTILAFAMLGFSFRFWITFSVLPADGQFETVMRYTLILLCTVIGIVGLYPFIPLTQSFWAPVYWYMVRDHKRFEESLFLLRY